MPNVAAFIDELRETFGVEMVNQQIRKGLNGEPTFYASENGHELGTDWNQGGKDASSKAHR